MRVDFWLQLLHREEGAVGLGGSRIAITKPMKTFGPVEVCKTRPSLEMQSVTVAVGTVKSENHFLPVPRGTPLRFPFFSASFVCS
jgi:hypothetical protein